MMRRKEGGTEYEPCVYLWMYKEDHPPAWHEKGSELIIAKHAKPGSYVFTEPYSNEIYYNPLCDYALPITEATEDYNKYCHERLKKILGEIKGDYLVLIYLPCEKTFDIPDGEIIMPVLGEADVPQIYVKGTGNSVRNINVNEILCQLSKFYKSDEYKALDFPGYELDKAEVYRHNVQYYKAYNDFHRNSRNLAVRLKQRNAEIEHLAKEEPYPRKLSMDHRRMQYLDSNNKGEINVVHWGQRKLFLSEMEFLTKYGDLAKTILYVGAATGEHTVYLSQLFPNHKFILYDPREFCTGLKSCKNVELNVQFFTDADVDKYIGQDILFFCDMRNTDEEIEFETRVGTDMKLQMSWHNMMKPKMSMLKLRLPYAPGLTEYLDGEIYYQVWAPATSTELRLITNSHDTVMYDNTLVEQICFRFNWVVREKTKYDEINEKKILDEFVKKHGGDSKEIAKKLTDTLMSEEIK